MDHLLSEDPTAPIIALDPGGRVENTGSERVGLVPSLQELQQRYSPIPTLASVEEARGVLKRLSYFDMKKMAEAIWNQIGGSPNKEKLADALATWAANVPSPQQEESQP